VVNSYSVSFDEPAGQSSWFVYLLPLLDYTAFKVGFSCNPLQRIYSFSRRYFERFDFDRALLLQMSSCAQVRAVEASIKETFAEFRTDAPSWVPNEAGGHTEWFSAVYCAQAVTQLKLSLTMCESARLIKASDFIADTLSQTLAAFEQWALQQAYCLHDDEISMSLGYEPTVTARPLRDWFDAYRFFDIALFKDDPAALAFVTASARLR
jgi:hypothetical protein